MYLKIFKEVFWGLDNAMVGNALALHGADLGLVPLPHVVQAWYIKECLWNLIGVAFRLYRGLEVILTTWSFNP